MYISSNKDKHTVTKTFNPLHNTSANYTSLHFTTLSFGLTPFKFPTTPLHLTSLNFTSLNFTAFQKIFATFLFLSLHPFLFPFLTLFLNILRLQQKVPTVPTVSLFQLQYNINPLYAL